jgi:cAMP-dependent protein kinase regulator
MVDVGGEREAAIASIFSDLPRDTFASVVRRFAHVVAGAGERLVGEGEPGDAMYAILRGRVRVERRSKNETRPIAEMTEGDFFGEMSLLSSCPRFASVTAITPCDLLVLGRADLDRLTKEHPGVRTVIERFYKQRLLANVLRASPILREVGSGEASGTSLAELFTLEAHPAGKVLLAEGAPGGRGMYLLLRGRCEVFHRRAGGDEEAYPSLGEGDVFGEVSLLQGGAVTASVRTSSPCVVLGLHREWVDEILLQNPRVREAIYDLASRRLERTQELLAKDLLDERLV